MDKRERYLAMCKLPPGIMDLRFETFNSNGPLKEAYDAALQLADNTGQVRWLTLIGDVDCGKTHLAISVCRRWLERGEPARYAYVPEMLDELRHSYDEDGERSFNNKFYALCNVPLLVLDDLGVEKPSEWAVEKLNTIVHLRDVNGKLLMVTTNVPVNELPPRIASRLQRVEGSKIVAIDAPEFRLRRRKV